MKIKTNLMEPPPLYPRCIGLTIFSLQNTCCVVFSVICQKLYHYRPRQKKLSTRASFQSMISPSQAGWQLATKTRKTVLRHLQGLRLDEQQLQEQQHTNNKYLACSNKPSKQKDNSTRKVYGICSYSSKKWLQLVWWYTVLKRKSRAAGREPTAAEFWKKQRSF